MAPKNRVKTQKVLLWIAAIGLLLLMAYPAWAVIFAPANSVLTKSLVRGAVTSAKIKDGTIINADIAGAAAIAAGKINRAGLNADLLDGKHAVDFVAKTGNQTMAGALTASNFNYGGAQTRYLSIPAAAFTPIDNTTIFSYDATGGLMWNSGGSGGFRAPVELPQGATITNYRFTANDVDPTGGAYVDANLMRWSSSGSNEMIGQNSTFGLVAPGWIDLDNAVLVNPTIDNTNYSYFVAIAFGWGAPSGGLQIGSVTITYTVPSP